MSTAETYEEFYEENVRRINTICGRIVCLAILVPFVLILCVKANIFYISIQWLIYFSLIITPYSLFQFLLVRKLKNQRFVTYYTLIGIELIIVFLGSNANINIYITSTLVPFLSCLYFDKKLTNKMTFLGHLGLLVSLWFKSETSYILYVDPSDPVTHFTAYAIGTTVEYVFVYFITNAIVKGCQGTLENIYSQNKRIRGVQRKVISSFANLVESRDSFTGEHIKRTTKYVEMIAKQLVSKGFYLDELTPQKIELFVYAAPLHDLGKIHVSDQILCKPSRFTPEEFEIMKIHAEEGKKLIEENLTGVESEEYLNCAKIMALYHHEKWDGSGYPNKVAGKDIPLCARIMAAADVLDALLSKRQYKEAMSIDEAFSIFEESRGTHFEPCIVDAVLMSREKIAEIACA